MVESFEDGDLAALVATEGCYALNEEVWDASGPSFFAEHTLDIERYRRGVCLVYGSDPRRHKALREELGAAKACTCEAEWRSALAHCNKRIEPIVKAR